MKQFGLIGLPLIHSFSKKYFNEKFLKEQIQAQFELFELAKIEDLETLIASQKISGLSVTIPYKEKVIKYLNEMDETAAQIGAVNVIKFQYTNEGLRLKGYNSDAIGFRDSLEPLLLPHHKKALILGTGGASKAVDYTLQKLGIQTTFVSRTAKVGMLTYEQLTTEILSNYFLIVNTSPVGTFPHVDECPDIPYEYLTDKHFLYDLVYNPNETLFMKKGKEMGAQVINGETMLKGQAEAAWSIWNAAF